ncbi:MAG: hypothetical protein ACI9VS_002797, partial [Candidatus Binatia bacterium]
GSMANPARAARRSGSELKQGVKPGVASPETDITR